MTGACGLTPADILAFWRNAGSERWYKRDDAFDAEVRSRFFELWQKAAAGALSSWEATDDGALALAIVLDQFPRNMFRDDVRAYSSDGLARAVADRAIARGADIGVEAGLLEFLDAFGAVRRPAALRRTVPQGRQRGQSAIRRGSCRDHPPVRPFPASQSCSGAPDDAGGAGLSR
jgi:hypothetical protein